LPVEVAGRKPAAPKQRAVTTESGEGGQPAINNRQSTIGNFGLRGVWLDFVTRKTERPLIEFLKKM
jgi:hypothetical protein